MGGRHLSLPLPLTGTRWAGIAPSMFIPCFSSDWMMGGVLHQCGTPRSSLEARASRAASWGRVAEFFHLYPSLYRARELLSKQPLPWPSPSVDDIGSLER